jgi:hypothetical protein
MICNFTNPVDYTGTPPTAGEPFAFSIMTCDSHFTQITNADNGATFWVNQSLSYGDILILFFIIIFFVFSVFKLLWNFLYKNSNTKL